MSDLKECIGWQLDQVKWKYSLGGLSSFHNQSNDKSKIPVLSWSNLQKCLHEKWKQMVKKHWKMRIFFNSTILKVIFQIMQALTTNGQGNTRGTNYCFPASWTNFFSSSQNPLFLFLKINTQFGSWTHWLRVKIFEVIFT